MPCSGSPGKRSTLQEEGCAEQQILHSDKQIDALNQKIFNALHTNSARRDLIAGHRAWLAYRKSYCLSVSDVFQGGTLAGWSTPTAPPRSTASTSRTSRRSSRT